MAAGCRVLPPASSTATTSSALNMMKDHFVADGYPNAAPSPPFAPLRSTRVMSRGEKQERPRVWRRAAMLAADSDGSGKSRIIGRTCLCPRWRLTKRATICQFQRLSWRIFSELRCENRAGRGCFMTRNLDHSEVLSSIIGIAYGRNP
jgi:hypothetical protein